jgi:hypothetical protein
MSLLMFMDFVDIFYFCVAGKLFCLKKKIQWTDDLRFLLIGTASTILHSDKAFN